MSTDDRQFVNGDVTPNIRSPDAKEHDLWEMFQLIYTGRTHDTLRYSYRMRITLSISAVE